MTKDIILFPASERHNFFLKINIFGIREDICTFQRTRKFSFVWLWTWVFYGGFKQMNYFSWRLSLILPTLKLLIKLKSFQIWLDGFSWLFLRCNEDKSFACLSLLFQTDSGLSEKKLEYCLKVGGLYSGSCLRKNNFCFSYVKHDILE